MYKRLVLGEQRPGSSRVYASPDPAGIMHDSMTLLWKPLEYWPKKKIWREWKERKVFLNRYLPRKEPRFIEPGACIHSSAFERRERVEQYKPDNWPESAKRVEHSKIQLRQARQVTPVKRIQEPEEVE